ncbi:MAG: 4-deoxy-4-formamido-L-arabinose-phosphoundecaprenol deformylase, partial [Gammaproteobacteria bacterium]
QRFSEVFGTAARAFGAAGWQINAHVLALEEQARFVWASDTRGTQPFLPAMQGHTYGVPQLPTTLPTLDELVGMDGITAENVAEHLLKRTEQAPVPGHVYTLHAELEGGALLPIFEKLLTGWQAQGYALIAMRDMAAQLDRNSLAVHEVVMGETFGRSGMLALQGNRLTSTPV